MPNATDLLKQDHREVEKLFAEFEQTKELDIAHRICDELDLHTKVEEEIVYPELKKLDQELYQDAVEEHGKVDKVIEQVRMVGANEREKLMQLMVRMRELVDHHVKDEEEKDFPTMHEGCDDARLEDMGRRIEQRKQQLQGAPSSDAAASKEQLLDLTKEELYDKAKDAGIEGRSKLDKEGLAEALSEQ